MRFKNKLRTVKAEFVELIPEVLDDGILYISIPYATASHKCACGCGEKVVTPLKPDFWSVTWNGLAVSLEPSIGNFGQACKSHYWIIKNKIVWAKKWNQFQTEAPRSRNELRAYPKTSLL